MAAASDVLAAAAKQVGVREDPPGSNRVRYNTWYYGREVSGKGYPWCMVFVQWVFHQAGVKLPRRTASCGDLMRAAQAAGCWVTAGYRAGDVVIYDFPGGAATDHCGIVEGVSGTSLTAIEGNTSDAGSQSDGGRVCRKTRPLGQVVGAVRPEYEEETMTKDDFAKMMEAYMADLEAKEPGAWSAAERAWAESSGLIKGDNTGKKKYKAYPTREELAVILYRFARLLGA